MIKNVFILVINNNIEFFAAKASFRAFNFIFIYMMSLYIADI